MTTLENLNQTSSSELRQLLERNGIKIKRETTKLFEVYCPDCNEDEAYVYFNQGSRNIECNRKNGCGYKEGVWEYIKERKGFSTNEAMLQYVNEELGYEFKYHNSTKTKLLKSTTIEPTLIKTEKPLEQEISETKDTSVDIKTDEEILEERKFFKTCYLIFTECLYDTNSKQAAFSLNYLKETRGYSEDQIKSFKLGFFPNKEQFISLLINHGYSHGEAKTLIFRYFKSVIKNNDDRQATEENKNRIVLTWFNTEGDVVGFTVRKPTSNNKLDRKYLNNDGFSKTNYLFNFTQDAVGKDLVIVEGQFDALVATYFSSLQEDTKQYHFVATGGSSISTTQIARLKSYGYSKVILLPDQDEAGKKGTQGSIERLLDQGITPYIASIPPTTEFEGIKDIDELLSKYPDMIDLKAILEAAIEQIVPNETTANNDLKAKVIQSQSNTTQPPFLDPEIQKLIDDIKDAIDRQDNLLLHMHEYEQRVRDLKRQVLRNKVGLDKRKNHNWIALNTILPDIREYNKLLSVEDDKSYSVVEFLKDIAKSSDGLKTGFTELDKHISIQPASLTFIAGRPGHGKTTMMLNVLKNMVEEYSDKSFLFYSYEETKSDILLKIILSVTQNLSYDTLKEAEPEGISFREKALNQLKKYCGCIKSNGDGTLSMLNPRLSDAFNLVIEWMETGRLQIISPKPSAESLSADIIERCILASKCSDSESYEAKPIAAVFIDYVQKLSTEEERVNRQQEIQRICHKLLTTALDTRVTASIILGAQVNRDVISLDTLTLDNMREAGDIEQDANLVLGVWNEEAGEIDRLLKIRNDIAKKIDEAEYMNKGDPSELKKSLEMIDNKIKKFSNVSLNQADSDIRKLKIKVLKNRNGQNNGVFDLEGYLDRYSIGDKKDALQEAIQQARNGIKP